ncbi:phage tail-collar fiber domain-containing protein [Pseudomonas huanghezhanensis]|uniref:phage tail-collar fiber domain-containing protein n=1 Tax=Pseudomonas huanghezhanensis TaxID=3002903 RepID=UPI0022868423|nr:phage tail protein [Pseudomonas sp. BSw22131]
MAAAITKAGESLIAQKLNAGEVLEVVRFVLALVPDLNPDQPVDRDGAKPPAEQVVLTQEYSQKGFVNPNQVVYSLMMGSELGDFDWNWMGLETAEGVLLSVAYVPIQQKRKNIPPHQIGNNVTRNFLVAFDGAQALTEITVDASTWQHDFNVRLHGIDERERLSNREIYGRACCFGSGYELVRINDGFQLQPGLAYVEGIRLALASAIDVPQPPGANTSAWLVVSLARDRNDVVSRWELLYAEEMADYVDGNGAAHFCERIATVVEGRLIDTRAAEPIRGALIKHFAAQVGDYPELRARATTKEDVELGEIPNAISDDPETDSSEILATTAALKRLGQQISDSMVGMVAAFDMEVAPPGWLKRNGSDVSRTAYAKLFAKIGTLYGAGDGVTTFNIGDSRGVFIRGLDEGRGLDPDRRLGSLQAGQIESHSHEASAAPAGYHAHAGSTDAQGHHAHSGSTYGAGSHSHTTNALGSNNGFSAGWIAAGGASNLPAAGLSAVGDHAHALAIDGAGTHAHNLSIAADGNHAHAIAIGATGGSETRPANVALLMCVKY